MKHLLIGGRGIIGSALRKHLATKGEDHLCTSRKGDDGALRFNLLLDAPAILPGAEIVYLVAGVPTFQACETERDSYRINVDATIAIARAFPHAFLVYVSSDAVEWCPGTALARQKAAVEAFLLHRDAAIVRPTRVIPQTAPDFAQLLASLGCAGAAGIFHWTA